MPQSVLLPIYSNTHVSLDTFPTAIVLHSNMYSTKKKKTEETEETEKQNRQKKTKKTSGRFLFAL